jgi:hypothetical protein
MGTTLVGLLVDGRSTGDRIGRRKPDLSAQPRWASSSLTVDDSWAATILAQDPSLKPERDRAATRCGTSDERASARATRSTCTSPSARSLPATRCICAPTVCTASCLAATLQEFLGRTNRLREHPAGVVDLALRKASRDNLTALVVRYEEDRMTAAAS